MKDHVVIVVIGKPQLIQVTAGSQVWLCPAELLHAISTRCRAPTHSLENGDDLHTETLRHAMSLHIPSACLHATLAGRLCKLSLSLPLDLNLRWYNHQSHGYRLLCGTCLQLFK